MQKNTVWIILLLTSLVVANAVRDNEKSFENFDIKNFKINPDRIQEHIDCMLDYGECNDIDARFKARAKDLLASYCSDCSKKELQLFHDIAWIVITKKSKYLKELEEKYDEEGNLRKVIDMLSNVPSLVGLSGPKLSAKLYEKYLNSQE